MPRTSKTQASRRRFVSTGSEQDIVLHCVTHGIPVLLRGPTGCGKSLCVAEVAKQLRKRLVTVTAERGMSASKILGAFQLRAGESQFVPSPLIDAVQQENTLFYLDEVRYAAPEAISVLNSLLDHRRTLFVAETGQTIEAGEGFAFAASYNPGSEYGRGFVNPALRQRCVLVDFSYLPPNQEHLVVRREAGASIKVAKHLVQVADFLRSKCAGILPIPPSTRLLILAARLVTDGVVDLDRAVVQQVVGNLTDDPVASRSAINALCVEGLLPDDTRLEELLAAIPLRESESVMDAAEFFS